MTLRVLLVTPPWLSCYSYELAQGLCDNGKEVIFLTTRDYQLVNFPSKFLVRPVLHQYAPWFESFMLYGRWRALRSRLVSYPRIMRIYFMVLWTALRYKVSVCHFQWMISRYDHLLYALLNAVGISVVYTVHNAFPHEQVTAVGNKDDYSNLYHSANMLIAHVEATKQSLSVDFGISEKRIAVIPHGSYSIFFQDPLYSEWQHHSHDNRDENKVILFFGQIRQYKGIDVLLDAFAILRGQSVRCKLLIVGHVPEKYGVELDLSGHPFSEDIESELRIISLNEIPVYFLKADIVALPYIKIDQSGVLLTAYTFGKPVVASDVGGFSETVEKGKSGLLVPASDPNALAGALLELLSNEEQRERMGAYAKHLAETKYSWTEIAKQTVALYRQLL